MPSAQNLELHAVSAGGWDGTGLELELEFEFELEFELGLGPGLGAGPEQELEPETQTWAGQRRPTLYLTCAQKKGPANWPLPSRPDGSG